MAVKNVAQEVFDARHLAALARRHQQPQAAGALGRGFAPGAARVLGKRAVGVVAFGGQHVLDKQAGAFVLL